MAIFDNKVNGCVDQVKCFHWLVEEDQAPLRHIDITAESFSLRQFK